MFGKLEEKYRERGRVNTRPSGISGNAGRERGLTTERRATMEAGTG